jgi:hypothetical protein
MSKKHFIALADAIRNHNDIQFAGDPDYHWFSTVQLEVLADFCQRSNPHFKRDRWLAYIAGKCGPNGGRVKS